MEHIVEQADLSVGTFYKRFASKEDLLPALIERTEQQLNASAMESFASARWRGQGLRARIDFLVDGMVEVWNTEARVVRAALAAQHGSARSLPEAALTASRQRMQRISEWLLECRAEIRHPEPERAVSLGLYFCLQPLQAALLGHSAPRVRDPALLCREAKRLLLSYLAFAPEASR